MFPSPRAPTGAPSTAWGWCNCTARGGSSPVWTSRGATRKESSVLTLKFTVVVLKKKGRKSDQLSYHHPVVIVSALLCPIGAVVCCAQLLHWPFLQDTRASGEQILDTLETQSAERKGKVFSIAGESPQAMFTAKFCLFACIFVFLSKHP